MVIVVGKATPEPVAEVMAAPADMRFCAIPALILTHLMAVVSTGLAEVWDVLECQIEEFGVIHAMWPSSPVMSSE
jgi:hypothetical protein